MRSIGMKGFADGERLGAVLAEAQRDFRKAVDLVMLGLPDIVSRDTVEQAVDEWTHADMAAFVGGLLGISPGDEPNPPGAENGRGSTGVVPSQSGATISASGSMNSGN
jgi:hypothetical protein